MSHSDWSDKLILLMKAKQTYQGFHVSRPVRELLCCITYDQSTEFLYLRLFPEYLLVIFINYLLIVGWTSSSEGMIVDFILKILIRKF